MKRRTMLTTIAMLLVGAASLSAQTHGAAGMAAMDRADHAEIGTIEAIGSSTNRVAIALPSWSRDLGERATRVFDTNDLTAVEGLGSMRDVAGLREHVGGVVVIRYVRGGDRPLAKEITFVGPGEIRETHGYLTDIKPKEGRLALRNPAGLEERMLLGDIDRTPIDTGRGLVTLSDLRMGDDVTVYFLERPGLADEPGSAYLVQRNDT